MRLNQNGKLVIGLYRVSIPLRGKVNCDINKISIILQLAHVSIPLRGKVNCDNQYVYQNYSGQIFVSIPLRGKVNCDLKNCDVPKSHFLGFNPLAGKSELRLAISIGEGPGTRDVVSIPLRGKVNCDNTSTEELNQRLTVSIPLRGKVNCDCGRSLITNMGTFLLFQSPCGEK